MTEPDYETHLKKLRTTYVESTPKQRLNIAGKRLSKLNRNPDDRLWNDPDRDPNSLVVLVSAIEGFARCLVLHQRAKSKAELSAAYPNVRNRKPEYLVSEYLKEMSLPPPNQFFGEQVWRTFSYAVKYRHLLVHECTYLGQDTSMGLIQACREVLDKLAISQGLPPPDPQPSIGPS